MHEYYEQQEHPKTILLVEDEALIAVMEKETLKRHGFDVILASSGEKAVEIAQAGSSIDLILMDINLGRGMDGTEAAGLIHKERDIPLLFLSSYTQAEVVQKTELITSYGYVVKDSGENVLITSIKTAFKLHEAHLELKEREQKLKDGEILYRSLYENMLNGFAHCQMIFEGDKPVDFIYLSVNHAFETLTGLSDVIGKKVSEVIPGIPESDQPLLETYGRVSLTGKPERFEMFLESLKMWCRVSVYSPAQGHFVAIFDVITERKQTEERLVRMNERFALATHAAHLGVWDWDIGNNSLLWDDGMYALYGVDRESFSGAYDAWLQGLHPDDRHRSDEISKQALRAEREYDTEFRILWPDGTVRILKAYGMVIRDQEGNPLRMIGVNYDITEQKRSEDELRETRDYLDSLINHANAPIITWDPYFRITRFNHAFERLTGRNHDEVLGTTLDILFPDETRETSMELIRKALEGKRWEAVEIPILTKDGSVRTAIWNSANIIDKDGRTVSTIAQGVDITDRKLAEKRVTSLLEEKELLIKEVHHRIKNNMNTIMALLSLQSNRLQDPGAVSSLEDARNRVRSMMVLYDKLYRSHDFSAVSTKTYLASLVEDIVANFPNREQVVIETRIDDVRLDTKILSSIGIITNELLTNAMKYAFPGKDKGLIRVSFSAKENHAILTIYDDGVGIRESVEPDRGRRSTDIPSSAGFGMQLVGMLAKQLQGTLRLERQKGSEFILEFDM